MKKTILKKSLVLAVVFISWSCASTNTIHHNKNEGSLYLFSHSDPASNDKKVSSDLTTQSVIDTLKDRLKKNPKDVESAISLANIYLALSNSKLSIRYAKQALRFNLKEHRARLTLAQNYYRLKKYKLAEIILSSLPTQYDNDPDILNIRALISYFRGRKSDSWALFNKGIADHPEHIALSMNFGVLLLKHRQIEKSKKIFENVVSLVPDHTDAIVHLAIIDATEGNFSKAKDTISDLTSSGNRLSQFNLGIIAYAQKDYRKAETLLKKFMANKSANRLAIESASIVLEKIAKNKESAFDKAYAKKYKKAQNNDRYKKSEPAQDSEIDALEKELTE
jgi:Flp pilus assembly protein TadD